MRFCFLVLVCGLAWTATARGESGDSPKRVSTELLIVGGTESGCAAAVQAARMGVGSITLVNDIEWLGGQFSAEALVAIDENRNPEGYGHGVPFPRTGLFKEVMDGIEAVNLKKYGRARPGNTRVITTCRPADAEAVFRKLLEPHVASGRVRVFSHYYPESVDLANDGKTVRWVRFRSANADGGELVVEARMTVDASDWGEVIRASGAGYMFGPDLRSEFGEPLAPTSREEYPVTDMNPITYCMVLEETEGDAAIPKPEGYDARNYEGLPYPKDAKFVYGSRRIVDHYAYPEIEHPDSILVCFPAFDYPLDVLPGRVAAAIDGLEPGASRKNIVEMTRRQRQIIFDDAKQHTLGYLHYLQTVVHERTEDKRYSFRRFVLSDEFGTGDRMPLKPYVRESLRLKAAYVMRQQDTTGHGGDSRNFATAMYHDGVACWQFEYDFHPTGRRFLTDDRSGPWHNYFRKDRTWGPPYAGRSLFPLRSLVPMRVEGLLGAQKNLGYTSIVSSAVRLHDQSMAIGQAAGAVAAVAIQNEVKPRDIPFDASLLAEVWGALCGGVGGEPQILWPFRDVGPEHAAFVAINQLAIRGCFPLEPDVVDFEPDAPADEAWREVVVSRSRLKKAIWETVRPPTGELTRGEFAKRWWERIAELPEKPFVREGSDDADGDGIVDGDDPLPFLSGRSSWPKWQLPADEDGLPDAIEAANEKVRLINFAGKGVRGPEGYEVDSGLAFDAGRGFGWRRDISANQRQRGRLDDVQRDTFLFTRSHDVWECALPEGAYRVTVCVGDSGHEQVGQNVTVEGRKVFRDLDTRAGRFAEGAVDVEVRDGRLTCEIGLPGSETNTCLNWIRVVAIR